MFSKQALIDMCRPVRADICEASTAEFISTLTEHAKLSHVVQWLARRRTFSQLEDVIRSHGCKIVFDFNTSNWCAHCTNHIQGFDFEYKGSYYCALQVHRGGDIRGNYTGLVVFEGAFLDAACEWVAESVQLDVDAVKDGEPTALTAMCQPSLTSEMVNVFIKELGVDFDTCESWKSDIRTEIAEKLTEHGFSLK